MRLGGCFVIKFVYQLMLINAQFQGGRALNHRLVERCVESLCQKGCRAVWTDIDALEAGETLPEAAELSPAEIQAVVAELKAVMAVYEGTCAAN
jgi:hypothetical protein